MDRPWNVGDVYLVHCAQGGVMGRLKEVHEIELVFERVDSYPLVLNSVSEEGKFYQGDGLVIVSRYVVASAEKMTENVM